MFYWRIRKKQIYSLRITIGVSTLLFIFIFNMLRGQTFLKKSVFLYLD